MAQFKEAVLVWFLCCDKIQQLKRKGGYLAHSFRAVITGMSRRRNLKQLRAESHELMSACWCSRPLSLLLTQSRILCLGTIQGGWVFPSQLKQLR